MATESDLHLLANPQQTVISKSAATQLVVADMRGGSFFVGGQPRMFDVADPGTGFLPTSYLDAGDYGTALDLGSHLFDTLPDDQKIRDDLSTAASHARNVLTRANCSTALSR